jgi:hypothetical protein
MTTQDDDAGVPGDLPPITGRLDAPAPAPADSLLRVVRAMQPVRTRARFGAFAAVLGAGLVVPLALLVLLPLRRDLATLPLAWMVGSAAVWLLASLTTLTAALVPARGDVLPSAGRASRLGLRAVAVLPFFFLFESLVVPGASQPAAAGVTPLLHSCLGCVATVLTIAAVFLVAGGLLLRRVLPMGGQRIGIALGAAGGAMGGLALLFHCPISGSAHVVLGHVGGVALAAVAGALLLPALLRRS